MPTVTNAGDMNYWNGTTWVVIPTTASQDATLRMISGVPTWVSPPPSYPTGTVHCGTATAVVEVTGVGGKKWMDRNLGTSQVAGSSTDALAYGDLYQWGRKADGHQCRASGTTTTQSPTDTPGHTDFIKGSSDWRSSQNDNLWQGVSGTNNPCPSGFRLPTDTEWNTERTSWGTTNQNAGGAYASPLKLSVAGYRSTNTAALTDVGNLGNYWSSTVNGTNAYYLNFLSGGAATTTVNRANGNSVRCIKD